MSNSQRRSREHLNPDEVGHLMAVAGKLGRHGPRDAALILLAYRHALRVSELVALRWDQVDLMQGLLHVNRQKNGVPSTPPYVAPRSAPYASCSATTPAPPISLRNRAQGAADDLHGAQAAGPCR